MTLIISSFRHDRLTNSLPCSNFFLLTCIIKLALYCRTGEDENYSESEMLLVETTSLYEEARAVQLEKVSKKTKATEDIEKGRMMRDCAMRAMVRKRKQEEENGKFGYFSFSQLIFWWLSQESGFVLGREIHTFFIHFTYAQVKGGD